MASRDRLIDIEFAQNKDDFITKLRSIMQRPQFCDQKLIHFKRIEKLLEDLRDEITYVFEFPYVDRHYRDTFYCYHSAKHENYYRDCIRIHLFEGLNLITVHDLVYLSDNNKEKYRGFFIIRPLPLFPLGRSLLSPAAFKNREIVCCLMKSRVSLIGHRLEAYGFPHISQDTETHTCAESSLWSILEYLGNRYRQYLPLLPSQITRSAVSTRRPMPSIGLNPSEILKCLYDNGCNCMVEYPTIPAGLRLLKIYIESGIPVYVFLKDSKKPGHAVLIIGHEDKYDHIVGPMDGKDWMDVSDFEKKVVVIDDNRPPYQIGSPEALLPYHKIISYIVPLPRHTNLDAQATFNICQEIFKDERFGLKQFGARWLTRLLLTGSHSFKMFLLKKSGLDEALKSFLVRLSMPKYVWICEIYKSEDFTREEKTSAGILILDSTGSKSISSVLFYYIDNKSILYNDNALTGTRVLKQIKKPFKMAVYKHNLKGAWNGWKL